eukprot:s800_g33.t1
MGWYEDPLGEVEPMTAVPSSGAGTVPNEGTDDWEERNDWNEQEGGSESTWSRYRKNEEEPPEAWKCAPQEGGSESTWSRYRKNEEEPPEAWKCAPQELARWSSNSSWRSQRSDSSAGEWSDRRWNSWRGISWRDKEDIDIWLQCSNLGEHVPETMIVPCKTPFEGWLADSAYQNGLLEDHKWFGKQELLQSCREQGTPLGLVIDLVNMRWMQVNKR